MTALRSLCTLALLASLPSVASADVIVADASGGGDFTDVRQAMAAAADGDIVLVRPGSYPAGSGQPGLVLGKAISVVGDGPGVSVPSILVNDVPAGGRVVLRGLEIRVDALGAAEHALVVQSSQGRLFVEDCSMVGKPGVGLLFTVPGTAAASLTDSAPAVFSRCTFQGGAGIDSSFPYAPTAGEGGPGLETSATDVSLYDCTVIGGDAGDDALPEPGFGGLGGDAVRAAAADVFVSGGTLRGGAGGDGDMPVGVIGYVGGDAIESGAGSTVRTLDVELLPGPGGVASDGSGPAGQALHVEAGSHKGHAGVARSYGLTGPAREQGEITATYVGEPGDLFAIFYAFEQTTLPVPGKAGSWHLMPPLTDPTILGPVTAEDGTFSITVTLPDFGDPLLEGAIVFGQTFAAPTSGGLRLSSPTTFVVLDGAF